MRILFVICLLTGTIAFHDEHIDDFTCRDCPRDSFCVDNARYYCPPNSTAIAFADSLEDCICNPGYNRTAEFENQVCVVGQPPYYYYEGIQYSCPGHGDGRKVTVNPLSYEIQHCVCTPGYFGVSGSTEACEICAVNFYSEIYNTTQCSECSSNSQNMITGSKSVYDCKCEPGYEGQDGGTCTACPAGKFKSVFGNSSCETCPENTFSHIASTSCSQCPGNSTAGAESVSVDNCLCNAGFSGVDGGPCVLCAIGKFKDAIANVVCMDCDDNTFSEIEGAVSCVSCLNSSAHSTARDRCLCNAGYTQADTVDTRPDCTPCAANTYQSDSGQTSCFECDANANGPEASATPFMCLCNAGFYDKGGSTHVCESCAAGKYKDAAPDMDDDETPCPLCPVNSHSPVQSAAVTDCICNAGFEGPDGGACIACLAGKFKNANGSVACDECTLNFFSDTSASTACESCVEFLNSAGAITEDIGRYSSDHCVCDIDQGFVEILDLNGERTCTGCQPGTYAAAAGCENCTGGQYADVGGLTACKDCPVNSSSYEYPHVACQCHAGYLCAPYMALLGEQNTLEEVFPDTCPTGNCVACAVASFKNYTGGADNCYNCQANSVSALASVSQADCECGLGYKQDGPETCVACLAGHYTDTLDSATCTPCGDRFYTEQSDFPWTSIAECTQCEVCNTATNPAYEDHYDAANNGTGCGLDAASECVACPTDTSLFQPSTADNWNAGQESCKCDYNLYGPSGGPCTQCPANSIRNFTDSSSSISDCVCDFGFEPDPEAAHECRACPVNTFKTVPGDYDCTPCPSVMVTESEGATNYESCVCPPGYYFDSYDGFSCVICQADTYKTGLSRQTVCDACVNHSVSTVGSDENSDCLCQRGFGHVGGPATTISYYMSRWRDRNSARSPRIFGNVLAPQNQIPQATYWKQVSGYYNRYANRGYSISRMNELTQFVTTPCYTDARAQASYYTRSLSDIVEELTQTPCASNYNDVLYNTNNALTHSCLWMPVDYTRSGVTTKLPGVVYLDKAEDSTGYYYQLFVRIYVDIDRLEYDWKTLQANDCRWVDSSLDRNDDPTVVGGGSWRGWGWGSVPTTLFVAPAVDFSCEICLPGEQKNVTANEGCDVCEVDTFAFHSGTYVCEACAVGKSTNGLTGKSYCECDAGTERESSNVLSDCQDCAEGKFRTAASYEEPNCQNCSHCGANKQVNTVCSLTQDITCKACQANSWSYAGKTELGLCFCNAGYELVGSECVACPTGKARSANMNNSIMCTTCQDGKFADTEATTECEFCAAYCNGTIGVGDSSINTYVSDECEVTRDTVCVACTACPPGQYATQSCGIPFNNDRNDTKCALCPAGFYCPGGTDGDGVDVQPEICPDLSSSVSGSDSILDCQCAPGYFHNGEVCQLCILDTYCPGENVVRQCPSAGITHHIGSIHRIECHCFPGHYRNPPSDLQTFNCSVCTPNDYCFNNSLYDCPDFRMISDSGSISFKNCTCMDGFYNNGSKCEECPIDHFCTDGNVIECDAREWTNHLSRQSKCTCRPKLFRSEEICTACTANFYCDGTDDLQKHCPLNSVSDANSSSLQQCLCVPGYEHIHAQNYTLAHTCVSCEDGKFKDKHGMYLCTPCRKCLAINNIFELHSCTTVHDTVCDSCETCHKNHPDEDPRFVQEICSDHQNAICGPCSVCNFTNEYEKIPCSPETGNTVCTDIIKTSEQCLSGHYRGLHTMYSQSICSACQFRDTKYHDMTLHVPSGPGLEYDNAYSCPVQCLGNSVLRDVSDMSLGCRSCEAGNVLLRNIQVLTDTSGNKVNCSFTCRNGYKYDPARDDCFVSSLESSEANKFDHTFEISNFQHEINGFSLRVTHTNHGKFMVVIGPSEPSDCRKNFCCQSNLWRVSTLEQAGLNPSIHSDSCSKPNELNQVASTKIDPNTITFNVSDSVVNEVGTCTNAANGTVSCLFTVSMIDLILRKSISRQIVIQTKHSVQYAFINNPQKYIPLSFLQADILFLYNVSEIPYFQMTLQLRSDTDMHISTRVSGLNQLDKDMLQPCPRLSSSTGAIYQNVSESVQVSKNEIVTLVSYWYGTTNRFYENEITFSHFLAYLTLQIGGLESYDIMDVAVSRKLSLLNNLCHVHTHSTTLNLGHILYTAGLGQSSIQNLVGHNSNFVQARGEIGTMFTFLAYSELPETETISLERGMAVHLSKPNLLTTTELKNAVNVSYSSNFDFTPSFRSKCLGKRPNCVYGYFNNLYNTNPIFTMNNCSEYNRKEAQKWIASQMGAANDQGHISSLCSVIESLHAYSTKAFFINSMSFVDKRNPIWNTYQNWTSPGTSTYLWAKFKFDTSA